MNSAVRKKVQDLGVLIDLKEYENVRQWFWRQKTQLFDDLVHDIRISEDLPVVIDTVITSREWTIRFGLRHGDRSSSRLPQLLRKLEIPFEKTEWNLAHPTHFSYDENLDNIRPFLQNLVDKLATSQEREE